MRRFAMYLLDPSELTVLAQRIMNLLMAFVANEPALKAVADRITLRLGLLEQALSRDVGSDYTQRLLQRDMDRDDAFLVFRNFVHTFVRSRDAAKKDASKAIMKVIRKYGYSLHSLGYLKQSNAMNLLLAELKEPKNVEYINVLGAQGLLETMQTTAEAFEATQQEKVDTEAEQDYPATYASFRDLASDLRVLIKFMQALNQVGYKPELKELMAKVEMELKEVTARARARQGRAEDDDSEDLEMDDEIELAG